MPVEKQCGCDSSPGPLSFDDARGPQGSLEWIPVYIKPGDAHTEAALFLEILSSKSLRKRFHYLRSTVP